MQRHGVGPLGYGVGGPEINLDSSEDKTYVALEHRARKDEKMESEVDSHIWLEDGDHPTSSHRPKSCCSGDCSILFTSFGMYYCLDGRII